MRASIVRLMSDRVGLVGFGFFFFFFSILKYKRHIDLGWLNMGFAISSLFHLFIGSSNLEFKTRSLPFGLDLKGSLCCCSSLFAVLFLEIVHNTLCCFSFFFLFFALGMIVVLFAEFLLY